jgi:hypothetical protein
VQNLVGLLFLVYAAKKGRSSARMEDGNHCANTRTDRLQRRNRVYPPADSFSNPFDRDNVVATEREIRHETHYALYRFARCRMYRQSDQL